MCRSADEIAAYFQLSLSHAPAVTHAAAALSPALVCAYSFDEGSDVLVGGGCSEQCAGAAALGAQARDYSGSGNHLFLGGGLPSYAGVVNRVWQLWELFGIPSDVFALHNAAQVPTRVPSRAGIAGTNLLLVTAVAVNASSGAPAGPFILDVADVRPVSWPPLSPIANASASRFSAAAGSVNGSLAGSAFAQGFHWRVVALPPGGALYNVTATGALSSLLAVGDVQHAGHFVAYVPPLDDPFLSAPASFQVAVLDDRSGGASTSVVTVVLRPNRPPALRLRGPGAWTTKANQSLVLSLTAEDPDGDDYAVWLTAVPGPELGLLYQLDEWNEVAAGDPPVDSANVSSTSPLRVTSPYNNVLFWPASEPSLLHGPAILSFYAVDAHLAGEPVSVELSVTASNTPPLASGAAAPYYAATMNESSGVAELLLPASDADTVNGVGARTPGFGLSKRVYACGHCCALTIPMLASCGQVAQQTPSLCSNQSLLTAILYSRSRVSCCCCHATPSGRRSSSNELHGNSRQTRSVAIARQRCCQPPGQLIRVPAIWREEHLRGPRVDRSCQRVVLDIL